MSAITHNIHSICPEERKLLQVVNDLKNGKVILYPTDTGFALGCQLSNKVAIKRIRQMRNLSEKHEMTFICSNLSNISEYAKVNNKAYKFLKSLIPGTFTFILPASKMVPKYAQSPSKRTIGIRLPESMLAKELIHLLGEPIISISAKIEGEEYYYDEEIIETYRNMVDIVIISDSYHFNGESTIIDMTNDDYQILRIGSGIEEVEEALS